VVSFNQEVLKWLSNALASLRNSSTGVKDTFNFVDEIKEMIGEVAMATFKFKTLFAKIR